MKPLISKTTGYTLFLFSLAFVFITETQARSVTAVTNGNWTNTSTWGGLTPTCGDTVLIPAGITVTINDVLDFTGCSQWIRINIGGTMTFQTGKKIKLPCNSVIQVYLGGQIAGGGGGGSSNLIDICTVTVWTTSMGTIHGPAMLGNEPLPITLVHFSGQATESGNLLKWITATENDNQVFYIGRSTDGMTFKTIQSIPGAGNSNTMIFYEYLDEEPSEGVVYYRLVQVDYDGHSDTSEIIAIKSSRHGAFTIYPNPCTGELYGSLGKEFANQPINVILSTYSGKVVLSKEVAIGMQLRAIRLLNQRDFIRAGNYIFSIEFNGSRISQPLVVK